MTDVKLTPEELRLLDAERARGIPYPDDTFAWRAAHAAELTQMAAAEPDPEPGYEVWS
jgi:hypothetical protein